MGSSGTYTAIARVIMEGWRRDRASRDRVHDCHAAIQLDPERAAVRIGHPGSPIRRPDRDRVSASVMPEIVGRRRDGFDWAGGLGRMAEARSLTSGGWLISGWARWRAWAGPPGACWVKGAMIALVCGGGAPVWR